MNKTTNAKKPATKDIIESIVSKLAPSAREQAINALATSAPQFLAAQAAGTDIAIPAKCELNLLPYTTVLEFLFRMLKPKYVLEHILVPELARRLDVTHDCFYFGAEHVDNTYIQARDYPNNPTILLVDASGNYSVCFPEGGRSGKNVSVKKNYPAFMQECVGRFAVQNRKATSAHDVHESIVNLYWFVKGRAMKISKSEVDSLRELAEHLTKFVANVNK